MVNFQSDWLLIYLLKNFRIGMVIFHGSPEKFNANSMLSKLQEETEKRMLAEKQLRELERQISVSKAYIQRTQQSSPYHDRPKIIN